jgi:SNF2 family DNA or RNA helicase
MIDHIFEHPRCALWVFMGAGKSSSTLLAVDALRFAEDGPTIVLAPKRVARGTWPNEGTKWDNFHHLGICPILGTAEQRLKALKQHADIFTINYENIPWLLKQVGDRWPWRTIVADESTKLKKYRMSGGRPPKPGAPIKIDPESSISRARWLAKVAFSRCNRFIELTGTPSPNGLQDLWGQLWFLDKGERLGRTYGAFLARWFRYEGEDMATRRLVPMPYAQTEIQDRVKDICLSLKAEDWFDIEDPIVIDVPVELPPTAMKQYKAMEKEMFIEILAEGVEIEAFNAAAKTMKCLQIANGAIFKDKSCTTFAELHDAKLDALEDIVEEAAGAPILVAYHFKHDLARLKKRFPRGVEIGSKQQTEDDWNAGKIPIMFVHPDSAGHGLNLQDGGYIVVMFGHWWDLEKYQQVIERVGPVRQLQSGHPRPVYIYNIRAVGTIDTTVIARRTSKRRIQDLLLEAARRN